MREIILSITDYEQYMSDEIELTQDKAAKILLHIKQLFKSLQSLINSEKREKFLYNWLKYDSLEEEEANQK